MLSGCQTTQPNAVELTSEEQAREAADWIRDRSAYIEPAVQGVVAVVIYSTQEDSPERDHVIAILHSVSSNLVAIIESGKTDPVSVKAAFRVKEDYFNDVFQATAQIVSAEVARARKNGYGDLTAEILLAASRGIENATAR